MSRKKGKNKGKASAKNTPRKSTPSSRRQLSSHAWSPQVPAETMSKFSLADEARWMSNHRTGAFETGKRLRNMPVNFVSAGHLEGTIKEKNKLMAAESEADSDSDVDVESLTPSSHVSSPAADNTHAMANMAIRSPSPAESQTSSSADEVVFRGRAQPPATPLSKSHGKASSVTTAAAIPEEASATTSIAIEISMTGTAREDVMDAESDDDNRSVIQDGFAERRGDRPAWEGTTTPWVHRSKPGIGWDPLKRQRGMEANAERQNPHDTAMDDYLQNIQDFGLTDSSSALAFAGRTMDLDADSYSEGGSDIDVSNFDDGWDSDMIRDFDDLSTSYDEQETLVVDILSKRSRESGLQYLCVREGFGADEATWRLSTSLLSGPEKRLVRAFEDESHRKSLLGISDPSETDSDNGRHGSEDGYGDEDEDEDEYEEDFSDETIARVLQKQEELGLGSRDLVLYPGDPIFRRELDPHISIGGFEKPSKKRQDRVRGRGNRDPTFPSASAMADALAMDPYGGFDIMDTERPSLRHRKKGRRGPMPPELDDEDLNGQLQRAWAADRDKKRIKKAEREELRQQGLLGRKGKGPNLKVKYQGGIAMEDILEEIREFLMGDMQSLALPPMEASRRATIHQAAAFFNLTSRSRGDGQDRFTVLAKTSRTRLWTDDEYDIAIQRKGFQKRLRGPLHGQGGGRSSKTAKVRFGNRVRPQTGYQEGDTVGANAPELGPENKGHALLSKMGWSKGTGLGALDNKGILQPIAHTVKMNKAGLK